MHMHLVFLLDSSIQISMTQHLIFPQGFEDWLSSRVVCVSIGLPFRYLSTAPAVKWSNSAFHRAVRFRVFWLGERQRKNSRALALFRIHRSTPAQPLIFNATFRILFLIYSSWFYVQLWHSRCNLFDMHVTSCSQFMNGSFDQSTATLINNKWAIILNFGEIYCLEKLTTMQIQALEECGGLFCYGHVTRSPQSFHDLEPQS